LNSPSANSVFSQRERGLAFIVSAPAGTGKTTLVEMLTNEFANVVASVSYTTRAPRPGEIPGKHYHFISETAFEQMIAGGEFLDYVKLYDTYYGSSRQWIEDNLQAGRHVILTIDTQGARQLQGVFPATSIFILPPSREELRRRLVARRTETECVIEKRLDWADQEIAASDFYDYRFINADLGMAYQVLRSIVIAEDHRQARREIK
jgi:guanylate kinase